MHMETSKAPNAGSDQPSSSWTISACSPDGDGVRLTLKKVRACIIGQLG